MRIAKNDEVFGQTVEADIFDLEADPFLYAEDIQPSMPNSWDGPNGVFLARRIDGRITVIAGMRRILARREMAAKVPSLRTVPLDVFDGLSDGDAKVMHDAANIYARGADEMAARENLIRFRDALAEMHRRYDFGPMAAAPLSARVGLVVGRSGRYVEEVKTVTSRMTPFLLECYDRGWMSSYTSRAITGWVKGRGGERSKIIKFDEFLQASNPASKEDFVDALKKFEGLDGGADLIKEAMRALKDAIAFYEDSQTMPDSSLISELSGVVDRLGGASGGCPYLKGLKGE